MIDFFNKIINIALSLQFGYTKVLTDEDINDIKSYFVFLYICSRLETNNSCATFPQGVEIFFHLGLIMMIDDMIVNNTGILE